MLSMQRPDAKVLDGKLKLNMTVRMGFRCADSINSKDHGYTWGRTLSTIWSDDSKITWAQESASSYLELNKAKQMIEPYRVPKDTVELSSPEQEKCLCLEC